VQGSARQLELAAAEMAQAAANLVQLERDIVSSPLESTDTELLDIEQSRKEAAAVLERKMAAMEAVLAARRKPAPPPKIDFKMAEPMAAKMQQLMQPPVTSTGPAAGSGYELLLQVRPCSHAAAHTRRCVEHVLRDTQHTG
jgi:alpha-amylase